MFEIHRHEEKCVLPKERENAFASEEEASAYLDELLAAQEAEIPSRYVTDATKRELARGWDIIDSEN